jgi:uncharacterized membrane-anchored protein
MKRNAWLLLALLQFGVVGWMIWRYQRIQSTGSVHRFLLEPVDPADPFRGRYLQLSFEADEVALCPFNGQHTDRLYLSLGKDSLGFVRFAKADKEAPSSGEYLQADVADIYGNENGCATARLDFPFDRWYMNEELAPKAEKEVAAALTRAGTRCWLAVRIRDGKAVAEQLYINDTAIADWLPR